MSRLKMTLPLLLLAGAGLALRQSLKLARQAQAAETARRTRYVRPEAVRPAGPQSMDSPPKRWDIVDEQSDQSFPASDPPGNY